MRIILATIATLVVVGFIILTARIWGLGQSYPEYQSAYFQGPSPMLIVKVDTLQKAQTAIQENPNVIFWLDVRLSKKGTAFILPPERDVLFLQEKERLQKANPTTHIMEGGKLSDYSWEQINEFYKDTPALKEFYQQLPKSRFILNIVDNVTDAHTNIVDAIKDEHPDDRTLIQSEALVLIQAIKDLKPGWVYGTSYPDIMRLLSFDSLYILPAIQFKGDVFVAPFTIMKRPAVNDDVIVEMRRRHKKVILGPIMNREQFEKALAYKADGFITEDLHQLTEMMATAK